ncbi:MAG TPA: HAMP domain-containing sensor histidine kinase [Chitinophagaceae bacterium]|nr:HAMP domain-containing sensor histidine kinase [Chitinophagaceae bacterium]
MNKPRWLSILMGLTILGVAAFQLYWLKENYDREERSLSIKAGLAFKESVLGLQVKKLKLDLKEDTGKKKGLKIFYSDDPQKTRLRFLPKEELISSINVIRDKYSDTTKKIREKKGNVIISLNKTSSYTVDKDSVVFDRSAPHPPDPPHVDDDIFTFLFSMDSLQEPITIKEITSAVKATMEKKGLDVPFEIIASDSNKIKDSSVRVNEKKERFVREIEDKGMNEVTIGFTNPTRYQIKLGNTFPYIVKQISLPILFSVLLLGITVISFWLLYKNMLKQQRLAELKNEFISNITHELKTPIATVGVAIEALKNFNAIQNPERANEYLDISSNELQRLNLLVDKVLKLSMFEKKAIELKFETIDAAELINEVVASLKLQLEKKNASIDINCQGDLHLQGDRLHLQSVIFNLLDNSLKYSKENPVINISGKEIDGWIELKVRDNGIGIPAEYQNKIFDKFFRVPHGDTHNAKGYGLGLSYVAQVITGHGGTVSADSPSGEGTIFTIALPKQRI